MTTKVFTRNDIATVEPLWRELEKQFASVSITCRWDLVDSWIQLYGDVIEFWFVAGFVKDKVVGITLVTKETNRPLPLPVASYHIGTNGEPYSDAAQLKHGKILVKKGHEKAFYTAVIEAIQAFKWEEIVLDDFDASVADAISEVLHDGGLRADMERNTCRFMNLQRVRKNGGNILDTLSTDTRYSIRRSIKALGNDITVEWAENEEQALDILADLVKQYDEMWQKRGKRGMFASQRFSKFQHKIITKLFKTGSILLCRVTSKTYGTLGSIYMLVDNGIAYGYQMGLKDFSDIDIKTINKKRLRVGFTVHALCMQEALDRGLDGYNFGVGEYDYKNELTNDVSEVVSISVKRGFKPAVRDFLVNLYLKSDFGQKLKSLLNI